MKGYVLVRDESPLIDEPEVYLSSAETVDRLRQLDPDESVNVEVFETHENAVEWSQCRHRYTMTLAQ